MARPSLAFRFWSRVRKTRRCWLWTGPRETKGHGHFYPAGGTPRLAHRVAWELTHGVRLQPTEWLFHRCHEPLCVKPAHLRLEQKIRTPTGRSGKGAQNPNAKLTEADVRIIRAAHTGCYGDATRIRERFRIGKTAYYAILKRSTWGHV